VGALVHDIYTEPVGSPDTLAHLGPLAALAGTWEGAGLDVHPEDPAQAPSVEDPYLERYQLEPIDFQTNGPELYYGLRYHTHIVRPGEVAMFHEQVGFWLWEPAARRVVLTVAIPRGQVALAAGHCDADARTFEVTAVRGSEQFGICTAPFLDANFTTLSFRMTIRVNDDGTWSYDQDTHLQLPDRSEPFHHVDSNTLRRVAAPTPNPLARAAGPAHAPGFGLGIGSLRDASDLRF
jgi:hypothetical protein